MSLFERLKNKRYDLQESGPNKPEFYTKKTEQQFQGSVEGKNLKKTRRRSTPSLRSGFDTVELENPEDQTKQKKLKQETSKRENIAKKTSPQKFTPEIDSDTKVDTKQRIRDSKGNVIANPMEPKKTPGSTQISGVQDTDLEKLVKTEPKTRTVKQSEVSKQAQNFTKEINKKNKNRAPRKGTDYFFDPKKARADREKLISKRKQYGIDDKGNISKTGVEKYARQIKQSNLPLTKKDLSTAKTFAVGGEKIKNKAGKVIGTTTGKYGGKLSSGSKYKAPTKPFAQIKAEYWEKKAEKKLKSATRKIEKKFAKELPSKQKLAKTFAPATKADRQFYKAGRKITKLLPKKAAPVAKKGLKLLTKAGPAGRIAGAVGLAMLSPGVRKTAAKIVGATAVGLGLTKAAGGGGGKTPIKPTITKKRINLSSGKD